MPTAHTSPIFQFFKKFLKLNFESLTLMSTLMFEITFVNLKSLKNDEKCFSFHLLVLKTVVKKNNFMVPFYGWGSTASRLEPLQGGSLLFTTKFPEIADTHFINLGRMNGWVHLGATQWFWTQDPWILGNMCIAIVCWPGCDTINFEIFLIFLIKQFEKFIHLQNKKGF